MVDLSKQSSSADHVEAGELSTLHAQINKILTVLEDSLKKLEADHSASEDKAGHSVSEDKTENLKTIKEYLRRTKKLFNRLVSFETTEGDKKKKFLKQVSNILEGLNGLIELSDEKEFKPPAEDKLEEVQKLFRKLYLQIPSSDKLVSIFSEADRSSRGGKEDDNRQLKTTSPDLHTDEIFKGSPTFRDLRDVYESLGRQTKLCFLCFAIIPENEVVKKRLMTSWWVGEGFVSRPTDGKSTNEEIADGILDELVKKGLIERIYKKRMSVANSYKMNPLIRSVVIVLAEEARLFDFDKKLNPIADFQKSYRACLVKGSSQQLLKKDSAKEKPDSNADSQKRFRSWLGKGSSEQSSKKDSQSGKHNPPQQFEKLQSIFNVSEPYPGFFESEGFSKLKNLKVLYLGATQSSAKRHIEVERVDFLKELKLMKHLRFFSFQGISRIMALPDSVYKLSNLRILDLRACHNLEELPNGIETLKKLTHLDLSECYLLDNIPKGVGELQELQVLKGFVIGGRPSANACTLADLSRLKQLRKLTIYTNKRGFPDDEEITSLQSFEELQKLTIVWGAAATTPSPSVKKQEKGKAKLYSACINLKNRGKNREQYKDAKQSIAAANKNDALEKQDNFAAEPSTATPINPKNSLDNKEQDREATQPVATTMNNGDQEKQEKVEAEPKSTTTTNPTNSGDNKERDKDAPQPVATPINTPKKNGDQEKQEKDDAESTTKATTNPTKNEDHKELDMDAARPIVATINGTKKEVNQKMQDKAEAEPMAPTTTYPTDGEDNKQQDIKDAIRPVAAATDDPKEEDDQKNQDKAEAEPTAAITTNPTDGEEKKEQDKDAVRPVAAATNGPNEGDQKKQDKAEAEPTAATTTNPTDGEENKELENDAVRPGAATNSDPKKDDDPNKQDKAKSQEGMAPITTILTNSGDISEQFKDVARQKTKDSRAAPREKSAKPGTEPNSQKPAGKFKKLEKLDLRCYCETKAPSWLVPDELENLQKLYIRGGELRVLGPVQENDKWNNVEILRLKFLSDLKMDWKEIRSSFPKLKYLEKFKCPQITFCPCDENGVWLSPPHQNEGLLSDRKLNKGM